MRNSVSTAFNRARVLVVDDDPSGGEALELLLRDAGYETQRAESGAAALEMAAARAPDLILLDVLMPTMDGFETCERLHRLPGLSDLPVIFLTGSSDRASVARAFTSGARDYVTKPFVLEELLARVRTHSDLKLSRDRLARMLQEREEITSMVAHDLKNPLTCVLFAAESMKRPLVTAERREELAEEVIASTRFALEFIQRFLSRSAEGQRLRDFQAEPLNLLQVAADVAHIQRHAAEAAGVAIVVEGDGVDAMADPTMTRNVLQNLVANAVQHSSRGSLVEIRVGRLPTGFAQCVVKDRGPGIPEAEQHRLFTRFVRIAAASDRGPYSSGLGLAIAKHDISQMGGYLWFEDREGGGSVFGFDLPNP